MAVLVLIVHNMPAVDVSYQLFGYSNTPYALLGI